MMYSVMLVDDERTIRTKLPQLIPFQACGFEVKAAARNGAEALEMLEEIRPDLILLDIRMPVMDGLEFLEKLRQGPFADTRVIILSSYSDFTYAQKAIRFGVKAYLTKPVDEDEAVMHLKSIREKLDQERTEEQPAPGAGSELLAWVHQHYCEPITLQDVAREFHMNAAYLGRLFQKQVQQSFRQYLTHLRIEQAKQLLLQTDCPIYEVAEKVGFSDSAYFVARFTDSVGMTPGRFRKQQGN